jgi:hypothetical protein
MFSTVLAAIIGLILVYFLLSIIVSGVNEILEAILKRRATYLEAGIADLLGQPLKEIFYSHGLVSALHPDAGPPGAAAKDPNAGKSVDAATQSPSTLRHLFHRPGQVKPSYLAARTFGETTLSILLQEASTTLVERIGKHGKGEELHVEVASPLAFPPHSRFLVRIDRERFEVEPPAGDGRTWKTRSIENHTARHEPGAPVTRLAPTAPDASHALAPLEAVVGGLPSGHLRDGLTSFIREAEGDLGKIQKSIEGWFDDKMERVSGWYKRRTKIIIFVLGLALVGALNADTVLIGRSLWQNGTLRDSVVAAANREVQAQHARCTDSSGATPEAKQLNCVQQTLSNVEGLGIPIGWPGRDFTTDPRGARDVGTWGVKLLGLLFTALALTLGAPFWFQLLNKFVNVRGSGSPPPKSDGTGSDDTG